MRCLRKVTTRIIGLANRILYSRDTNRPCAIPLPDDNPDAMEILFNILHFESQLLPEELLICIPIKTYGRRGTSKFQDPNAYYQHSIINCHEPVLELIQVTDNASCTKMADHVDITQVRIEALHDISQTQMANHHR